MTLNSGYYWKELGRAKTERNLCATIRREALRAESLYGATRIRTSSPRRTLAGLHLLCNIKRRGSSAPFGAAGLRTLLGVGGDGGAQAVGADALHGSGDRELLQAAFEVAVLSLQLLLGV